MYWNFILIPTNFFMYLLFCLETRTNSQFFVSVIKIGPKLVSVICIHADSLSEYLRKSFAAQLFCFFL